jgi:CheY-like chemotaxis protein
VQTDTKRLQQVLKNLLSNAFKFTETGKVEVRIGRATSGWHAENETLNRAESVLAFVVSDTGIGIPIEKQQIIFEAFQQADGSTSRRYGGTGLGLAISREISRLLGGEIRLESVPGVGSTFTLYLPQLYSPPRSARKTATVVEEGLPEEYAYEAPEPLPAPEPMLARDKVVDDRASLRAGDRTVLIVDNDAAFARFLLDMAHAHGFKGLVAPQGSLAVALAREFMPDAVTLDIRLPDTDGWRVLNHLKSDLSTRHIPVVVVSTDDERSRGMHRGAIEVLQKPVGKQELESMFDELAAFVERRERRLLIVEDNEAQRNSLVEMLDGEDVRAAAVGTGREALALLDAGTFDCCVADLGLPDMSGMQMIERARRNPRHKRLPVIVYTARDLAENERTRLRRTVKSIIVKDDRSLDRLLDETALYLHRRHSDIPESRRAILEHLHQRHVILAGKKVLVVDDDVRNIFAMTTVLEGEKMRVLSADNGRRAIEILETTPGIDVVLMDIMMPGMDGHAATRAIRRIPRYKALPIIALTAKAMKGDREKCIEAGASDYIAKPVDTEQLMTLLGIWLYR